MIPSPRLTAEFIQTIVTHDNCSDGLASAIILCAAYPDAELLFVQHGTAAYNGLEPTPHMLFCDIAPPHDKVQSFKDAGAIVLDHHATAEADVEAFGERGSFSGEPGVSGAMLAYLFSYGLEVEGPLGELATLIGIRDTWQKDHPRFKEAVELHEALMFWPRQAWFDARPNNVTASRDHDPCLSVSDPREEVKRWNELRAVGPMLREKKLELVHQRLREALRFTLPGGRSVACFQGIYETSDAADLAGTDLVVGFRYFVDYAALVALTPFVPLPTLKLQLSIRGTGARQLAEAFGGGGHDHAAGGVISAGNDNPWNTIRELLSGASDRILSKQEKLFSTKHESREPTE